MLLLVLPQAFMKRFKAWLVLVGFLIAVALLWRGSPCLIRANAAPAQAGTQDSSPVDPMPSAPREMNFPYYSLRDGYESTMFLIDHTMDPVDVRITVHGLHGEAVSSATLSSPARSAPYLCGPS